MLICRLTGVTSHCGGEACLFFVSEDGYPPQLPGKADKTSSVAAVQRSQVE